MACLLGGFKARLAKPLRVPDEHLGRDRRTARSIRAIIPSFSDRIHRQDMRKAPAEWGGELPWLQFRFITTVSFTRTDLERHPERPVITSASLLWPAPISHSKVMVMWVPVAESIVEVRI